MQNAQLVSKVFFPRLILPLSTVFSTLIDFGVSLAMMAVLMVVYHVPLHASLLLLPVWLLLTVLLASGLGLVTFGPDGLVPGRGLYPARRHSVFVVTPAQLRIHPTP